ncbi:serpentine type 7TM GPCR chemoreceptor srt domain-containing protein [Ditylenchus destructor]|nr:serpentine type 7TM GPCR chemoreceptor srt domain-containing protein [Ditylenchus destructor]
MSLKEYLFDDTEFDRLYNCSMYEVDSIPFDKRQHLILGWIFIALFAIFEILYIPCIFAISKHLQHSSFKIMFYIGIADVIIMILDGRELFGYTDSSEPVFGSVVS